MSDVLTVECNWCDKQVAHDSPQLKSIAQFGLPKFWCGSCKGGRWEYYSQFAGRPTNGFMKAVLICDSHDIRLGNYKDGFERERMLDRMADYEIMLADLGEKDIQVDCDCYECREVDQELLSVRVQEAP